MVHRETLKNFRGPFDTNSPILLKAEAELKEHLRENQSDIKAWYDLVILNMKFLHDEDEALFLLKSIAEKLDFETATILSCFIEDDFRGGVKDELYNALCKHHFKDISLSACKEFYLYKYLLSRKVSDCLSHLENCVHMKDDFVHAYIELGDYYKEQWADIKKAQSYYYQAYSSVRNILTINVDSPRNSLELDDYFNEMVYGTDCTPPKYEYIKGLVKDDLPFGNT